MKYIDTLQQLQNMPKEDCKQLLHDNNELLTTMLTNLTSSNPQLRDVLGYQNFVYLLQYNLLTDKQLHTIFMHVSHELLLANIGEKNNDTVFARAFSAILLADLLSIDRTNAFLTTEEAQAFFAQASAFLTKEQDTRTFVKDKGWANAIVFGSDLMTAIIQHPAYELRFSPAILQGIAATLYKQTVYINDEEERFAHTIEALIAKGYPELALVEWVEQLFDRLQNMLYQNGYNEAFLQTRTNTLHFIKTLYFYLKVKQSYPQLQNAIYVQISKWHKLGS